MGRLGVGVVVVSMPVAWKSWRSWIAWILESGRVVEGKEQGEECSGVDRKAKAKSEERACWVCERGVRGARCAVQS